MTRTLEIVTPASEQNAMIGKRCQLSEEARRRGMKMSRLMNMKPAKYAGKVIGETGDGKCWLVVWDGLNNSRPLEKVLIEEEV